MTTSTLSMPEQLELLRQADELRRQHVFREALGIYLELGRTGGEDPDLCRTIAICYIGLSLEARDSESIRLGAEALRWQERAVELAPDSGLMHSVLAEIIRHQVYDNEREAEEHRRAVALAPNDELTLSLAVHAAEVLFGLITDEEVLAWSERLVRLQPDKADYRARLAILYYELGRIEEGDLQARRAFLCNHPPQGGYVAQLREAWTRAHGSRPSTSRPDTPEGD